ncbi:MAG: iron response transcriptional regulator IrrA [Pseudomonadota bacterium]
MQQTRSFAPALDRLRHAGLRPTRQRLALARLLFAGGNRHVTAESLHREAQEQMIPVSLATIYNSLHQFCLAGLLREVVVESGRSYFDTNTGDHHHFYDEGRGELMDIPGEAIALGQLPQAPAGRRVARVDVIIRLEDEEPSS